MVLRYWWHTVQLHLDDAVLYREADYWRPGDEPMMRIVLDVRDRLRGHNVVWQDYHDWHTKKRQTWAISCNPCNKEEKSLLGQGLLPPPQPSLQFLTSQRWTRMWSSWTDCTKQLVSVIMWIRSQPSSWTTTIMKEVWTIGTYSTFADDGCLDWCVLM